MYQPFLNIDQWNGVKILYANISENIFRAVLLVFQNRLKLRILNQLVKQKININKHKLHIFNNTVTHR